MTGIRGKFLRQGVTIRTYLLALVLAAVIPLGAFVAALLYVIASTQEEEMESAVLESAEALAAAIESNIDSGLKRMAVLANESSLHVGNIDQFAQRCREAVSGSPDWRSLLLAAPDGTHLVNTLMPLSTPLPGRRAYEHEPPPAPDARKPFDPTPLLTVLVAILSAAVVYLLMTRP